LVDTQAEKAFAKLVGSYKLIVGGSLHRAMALLTGWAPTQVKSAALFSDADKGWRDLERWHSDAN
jgi:hypothetical protein